MMNEITSAEDWNSVGRFPGHIFTETEFQKRLASGPMFTVIGGWDGVEGSGPKFTVDVDPQNIRGFFVCIQNYGPAGSLTSELDFVEVDGRLFMDTSVDYDYPNHTDFFNRSGAIAMTTSYG